MNVQTNPRRFARIAGAFYLLTFVFGIAALTTAGDTRLAANLVAAVVYYVVTVMLYQLYKPVSPTGSLVTALFSFAALTIGVLSDFGVVRFPLNTLVLFGVYCIGLGWLTLKATFLPKAIGVLLIVAGLGWLTFVHPPLAKRLGAFAMAPGMVGEGALTLWLLARGVDPEQWRAQSTKSKA
ncbi:MAG: DUF4386 domain-containing protein [Thermoanaerobaculia bacterium]